MNDIKRPKPGPVSQPTLQPAQAASPPSESPITPTEPSSSSRPPGMKVARRRRWPWVVGVILVLLVVLGGLLAAGYRWALSPVDRSNDTRQLVTVKPGMSTRDIASELHQKGLIRHPDVFLLHLRLSGQASKLQTGSYRLAPSESAAEITQHIISGKSDEFSLTLYPGAVLRDPRTSLPDAQRTDVTTMLQRAGYGDDEIRSALTARYEHPLLKDKPAGASLEGYIYGETYQFLAGASARDVITRTLDEFYRVVQQEKLIDAAAKRNMSLFQLITLASVVQREVSCPSQQACPDQRQVAQIFYKRLADGMPLGADATFVYAAHQEGKTPSVGFDSPYNTRIHTGLPPGPIAAPGLSALRAVANPAEGDYLYFVSGDDGKNYFAHTLAEHEANTAAHCKQLCSQF